MKILLLVMPNCKKMGVTISAKLYKDYSQTALSVVMARVFRVRLGLRKSLDLHQQDIKFIYKPRSQQINPSRQAKAGKNYFTRSLPKVIIQLQVIFLKFGQIMKVTICLLLLFLSDCKLLRLPVNGSLFQGYHTTLYFGSQQTPVNLLIDTGSSLTVLQCINCIKCSGKNSKGLYSYQESLTSRKIGCDSREPICEGNCRSKQQFCQYQVSYGEGTSIYGDIIKDEIVLENQSFLNTKAFFGCIDLQNSVRNDFKSLLGLSPKTAQNILYPFFESNPTMQYQFSTCFDDKGGYFQIGVNSQYAEKAPTWTSKFYTSEMRYFLADFNSLKFGSASVNSSTLKGGVIVDTGSTFNNLPEQLFNKFAFEIFQICRRQRNKCAVMPTKKNQISIVMLADTNMDKFKKDIDKIFPVLQITVAGVKTSTSPSQYFYTRSEGGQYVLTACFGYIQKQVLTPQSDLSSIIILGMSWLQNKKIVFNLKQQLIKAYYNQNCTFTPPPKERDQSLIGLASEVWEYIKTVKIEYLVLFIALLVFVAIVVKKNLSRIKGKLSKVKQIVVRVFQRNENARKENRSQLQLNEESCRAQNCSQSQKQKPTVPKSLKKRGRNRPLKKKKQNS